MRHLDMAKVYEQTQGRFPLMSKFLLLSISLLLLPSIADAQTYTPLNPNLTDSSRTSRSDGPSIKERLTRLIGVTTMTAAADDNVDPFPRCAAMPTIAEVANLGKFRERLYSASEAVNAGILTGSVNLTGSQLMYISDYTRAKGCPTADGKHEVLYGQVIRTILTLSDWNAKGAISLPILAADATMNSHGHTITIEHYGFGGPRVTALISQINGKTFSVETYGEYKRIQSELINLMDAADSSKSIERIGMVSTETDTSLQDAPIIAFTLQQIKDGKSCLETKNKMSAAGASVSTVIENTCKSVTGKTGTEAPSPADRDKAKLLLSGIKVSK